MYIQKYLCTLFFLDNSSVMFDTTRRRSQARSGRPTPSGERMCHPVLVSIDGNRFAISTFPIGLRQYRDGWQRCSFCRVLLGAITQRRKHAHRLQQLYYVSTNTETGRETGGTYTGTSQPVLVRNEVYLIVTMIRTGSDSYIVADDDGRWDASTCSRCGGFGGLGGRWWW